MGDISLEPRLVTTDDVAESAVPGKGVSLCEHRAMVHHLEMTRFFEKKAHQQCKPKVWQPIPTLAARFSSSLASKYRRRDVSEPSG
jgi:hypothetical protein